MISKITASSQLQKLVVSTGNVLNATNKLGRKSSEELLDGLQLALASEDNNLWNYIKVNEQEAEIKCASKELREKLTENFREEISIGAKIFVTKKSPECVEEAVRALLQTLQVEHVDNVVLAFYPQASASLNAPMKHNVMLDRSFKWSGSGNAQCISELKQLWSALEANALQKQIIQLGVCDLDAQTLAVLHASARVPPTIAQINRASCCVVPQTLQEFCTEHDIQLLTHGDPTILLAPEHFVIPGFTVDWTLRFQVHVRCRGVIIAKGYLLGASRASSE